MSDQNNDRAVPIDHLLKRLEKGVATPEQQATIRQALEAEPLPDGIIPPTPATGPTSIPPIAYILHNHSQRCLACNSTSRWSATYSLFPKPAHWAKSNYSHFHVAHRLDWDVPIHSVQIAESTIPFCSECLDATQQYVATLPRPIPPQAVLKSAPIAPAKPAPAARARTTPAKPATIDDLFT
jgi:hypothetical protein